MENQTRFSIALEHIDANDHFHTFRVAFSHCNSRILLPYPQVTGIRLLDTKDAEIAEWHTRYLVSGPLDDFVLSPDARIAFDLRAYVNMQSALEKRWTIEMPLGACRARFKYCVDDARDWYDFLAKRSRFAAMTPPWNGTVESNTIEFVNTIAKTVG